MPIARHQVKRQDAGQKLQVFLHKRVELSVRRVKALIDRNQCRVNGSLERFGCTIVREGDQIELVMGADLEAKPKVVFEDEHLLVLNKPAGMPVGKIDEDFLCHRLDRDTSGLLIIAKSEEVQQKTEHLFRERLVKKRYIALVDGAPKEGRGTVENRLGSVAHIDGQTIYGATKNGQRASTYWQVIDSFSDAAYVSCHPETGRTHQIRVHLAGLGHPILGDGQYSRRFRCKMRVPRHMLHAERLILPHPVTGAKLVLNCLPPVDFRQALKELKCGS